MEVEQLLVVSFLANLRATISRPRNPNAQHDKGSHIHQPRPAQAQLLQDALQLGHHDVVLFDLGEEDAGMRQELHGFVDVHVLLQSLQDTNTFSNAISAEASSRQEGGLHQNQSHHRVGVHIQAGHVRDLPFVGRLPGNLRRTEIKYGLRNNVCGRSKAEDMATKLVTCPHPTSKR